MSRQQIMGMDSMYFFYGVVENVNDPLKLGRVQVRLHGLHTDKLIEDDDNGEGIPTENLPWAIPLQGITSGAVSGIGQSPTGIVNSSWVVGFSRDGEFMNDLIIMGTVAGIPEKVANTNRGFNDPDGVYPLMDMVGESDVNRLARNENIDKTIVADKKANIDSTDMWTEPETPYNATYPLNNVSESKSGHIHEIDDTPNAERIHTYHKSGTFEEIHPDGTVVRKIVGKDYEIVANDKNVLIKGNINVTILGDANIEIGGDMNADVGGATDVNSGGEITLDGTKVKCNGGKGVITGESICPFTGLYHFDESTQVTAGK